MQGMTLNIAISAQVYINTMVLAWWRTYVWMVAEDQKLLVVS
jgi:hypothetical protein